MAAVGLRDPLVVRPLGDESFEIVRGHSRYAAALSLGWPTVRVRVVKMSPDEAAIDALADVCRVRRSAYDQARLVGAARAEMAQTLKVGPSDITNRALHQRIGLGEPTVSEALAIYDLVSRLSVRAAVQPAAEGLSRISRDRYRKMIAAGDDESRAALLYEAVHAHPPKWAPSAPVAMAVAELWQCAGAKARQAYKAMQHEPTTG
jgi:ParB-like chromosome segregation protein Spo0J